VEVLRRSDKYNPVCFIDSKPALHGVEIDGLRVINPVRLSIECRPQAYDFDRVLLAIPSASEQERQHIVQELTDIGLKVKSVPGLDELLMGKSLSTLRDVSPDDVLGRDAVAPKEDMMRDCVGDKVVLVTGAGGSIGSEISRQLSRLGPAKLVLLDNSEPSLYQLEQEFSREKSESSPCIEPVLGSVLNKELIQKVLKQHGVQVVFHAAAYKHVPIVEAHPSSGARVNVLGTLNVADLSIEHGVERFVMVSTDKAVRPTNVMGATKRMAELLVQHRAGTSSETKLCMVRFGNVLGSSGSVVPKFLAQIDAGGPVTVTHPEVTRYFMTIPEASQLVIQAGAMAKGGEVYVLDMGEPKKITDLARQLISLRGLSIRDEDNPNGEIELRFTGLRPGEKLYEELLIDGENIEATEHQKISRANEKTLSPDSVKLSIEQFKRACQDQQDNSVVNLLRKYVEEYAPAEHSNHQSS
ncbi:MAG: polysaccharide biosynthesis protein, partial [Granulosicoccaceae bacterium]